MKIEAELDQLDIIAVQFAQALIRRPADEVLQKFPVGGGELLRLIKIGFACDDLGLRPE
jgi:hypothetical protein